MKLGVVGSNSISNLSEVYSTLNKKILEASSAPPVILGGGGKGVAKFTKDFCKDYNLDFIEFQPYSFLDKTVDFSGKYFFIRTKQIIDNSDSVIFFTNDLCNEVSYGIKYAQKINKSYTVVKIYK